jgi:A/G-specific adenine glycosylase
MTVAAKTARKKLSPLPERGRSPSIARRVGVSGKQNDPSPDRLPRSDPPLSGEGQAGVPQPTALLAWYDRHRRTLPWRAAPGERADPYRVWLSEIMLQQTTVRAVAPFYARFLARWGDVRALAAAPLGEVLKAWAGLGYYARARNMHACACAVVERHGGEFPANEATLRELPGIGPYTAAAIAAIAYDVPASPVDGNIERVIARLFAVTERLPRAKPKLRRLARALTPRQRAGDFAQAMMDLGAAICTPKKPACVLCPWSATCAAFSRGDAETFPRRAPKREGALRRGAAFVALRADGYVLVRTRPVKGLLGGMTEVPTTEWAADFYESRALADAPRFGSTKRRLAVAWHRIPGIVRHVFTHFPLELSVYCAALPAHTSSPPGTRWVALSEIGGEALPSLMRKVVAHALDKERITPRPTRRALARGAYRSQ